jgi:hypothetical protein
MDDILPIVGFSDMKNSILIILLSLLLTGCSTSQKSQLPTVTAFTATEITCPGVDSKGLSASMQAYFSITGTAWSTLIFQNPSTESKSIGDLFHHVRVQLEEGPKCDRNSAWWQITTPDGVKGWVQIGSKLAGLNGESTAEFLPFSSDAVQQDVPEDQKLDAQVRYILADIDLGGIDVFKYYQDQTAAKPEDPEMEASRIALEILGQWGEKRIIANPSAFERKPLRGGTSVVDAGTEFVQPGMDIRLRPCDIPSPTVSACKKISR